MTFLAALYEAVKIYVTWHRSGDKEEKSWHKADAVDMTNTGAVSPQADRRVKMPITLCHLQYNAQYERASAECFTTSVIIVGKSHNSLPALARF